jgi:squalene synthase HpnC
MAVNHYENFPVASFLLPFSLRPAVRAIYRFARNADDIADEGTLSDIERLAGLDAYRAELHRIERGEPPSTPDFQELQAIIAQHQLPLAPFFHLLSAFKQDVIKKRYENYTELLDYCSCSANPVGRLVLHLYGEATAENIIESDAICTALQLINFWQDVAVDWAKQRVYLPVEDMNQFGVFEDHIARQRNDEAFTALMRFQLQRTRELMLSGRSLALRLTGRIGLELRAVIQGGLRVIEKIERNPGGVLLSRPVLNKWDWVIVSWRSIIMRKV